VHQQKDVPMPCGTIIAEERESLLEITRWPAAATTRVRYD
jgi:hypothetical protein